MRDFHSEHYPELKQATMKIGQELSTPDFKIAIYAQTKAKGTKFGSSYEFKISVRTPDDVSEEETERQMNEKDWQKLIFDKLCKYYPDAKKVKEGLHIPRLKSVIVIPDSIFFQKKD